MYLPDDIFSGLPGVAAISIQDLRLLLLTSCLEVALL
jgi:hypothetical protein